MIGPAFTYIFRFVMLVLFQALVLNKIVLHGYATPYIYILFILLLPIRIPAWLQLFVGFALGYSIDLFSNTGGIHAFATVFLAYIRPFILKILTPPEGYEEHDRPTIKSLGIGWFFFYCSSLVLLHHFVFFAVEILSFKHFSYILLKTLFSSLLSIFIILLLQYLFYPLKASKTLT